MFQSEIFAIQRCAEALALTDVPSIDYGTPQVTIFSDSQAALAALISLRIEHKTVSNCIKALNEASFDKQINLAWVKAHANHSGNERADNLAKTGTTNILNKIEIPRPKSSAKKKLQEWSIKNWNNEWKKYPVACRSKIWFPVIDRKKSEGLLKLSRTDLGLMIQLLTGHNRLGYHKAKVDPSLDPTCRFCKCGPESTWHIVCDCPSLMDWRLQSFKQHLIREKCPKWELKQFINFVRMAKLEELNKGDDIDLTIA